MKNLDKLFYAVEEMHGEKMIHLFGNVYFNDASDTEEAYRLAEFTGFYLTMAELDTLLGENRLTEEICDKTKYLDILSEQEALLVCETYFDGSAGLEMDLYDITKTMPVGNYWCSTPKTKEEENG